MTGGVPDIVQQEVTHMLERYHNAPVTLLEFSFLTGGCINPAGLLNTSAGKCFIKWNDAKQHPRMFQTEALGLGLLRRTTMLHVPGVIGAFEQEAYQGIALELIESKERSKDYWEKLGHGLATLHRFSHENFGLEVNNYIGSLPQSNTPTASWVDFFIQQRLAPQLKMAVDTGRLDQLVAQQFEKLYQKLPQILPAEKPALLHGDLWTGNVITDETGGPCLIDPAVYYGNREVEIAFTRLFGGFDKTFYDAYEDLYHLAPGFEQRQDVYNLYPLLVHVNLFGGGYCNQVKSVLGKMA